MSSFEVKNLFGVEGKVVLVTGGSRGIGKMIATGFIKNGAKVYISSRSAADCDATAVELSKLGPGKCISVPADLQKIADVERLASAIEAKEKELHVLVNNAGAAWGESLDKFPDAAFTKILTLNVQRVFTLTQRLLPLLRAAATQGGKDGKAFKNPARIINIGSVEGIGVPDHDTYAYSASKAALHHLSRALGGRLGWEGIVSNTIACGPFQSKMTAYSLANDLEGMVGSNPSQRIGTPEDVAGTALFLASRAGAYVNGATITLDGGHLVSMPSAKL
jgi:NAD(P)-dependent dehydrogenase (short-subunit alcohol dehydrogenase family)